jgi:hypothetical protein
VKQPSQGADSTGTFTPPEPSVTNPLATSTSRLALLATLLTLAACGGGDGGPAATAPAPAPAPTPPAPPPPPVATAPVITALPTTLTVREGETGTISVAATSPGGSPLSYRWLRDGAPQGTEASVTVPALPFMHSYAPQSYTVEVSNAVGTTLSSVVPVQRVNREWLDVAAAHTDFNSAIVDSEGSRAPASVHRPMVVDRNDRIHSASVQQRGSGGSTQTVIAFMGVSKNSDADSWGYSQTLPTADGASADSLQMQANASGALLAAWREHRSATDSVLRVALYRPGASGAPGQWALVGQAHAAGLQAVSPQLGNLGFGQFVVAWLERGSSTTPRDAVMRRYAVPAAGADLASGWTEPQGMETLSSDITRLQLLSQGGNQNLALFFVPALEGGAWRFAWGGVSGWSTPTLLQMDHRFTHVQWAEPVNGRTMLAGVNSTNGDLWTRRVDLDGSTFTDGAWTRVGRADAGAPTLRIDADGRVDLFTVTVDSSAGNTSTLQHLRYNPASGWGGLPAVAQSSTNAGEGLGLRAPVVASDGNGNLVLGWLERQGSSTPERLMVRRFSVLSDGWGEPTLMAPAATGTMGRSMLHIVATPNDGRATATWLERASSGAERVHHARLR